MCGGKNGKLPTHVAIWRQGHLLHFGFQQSPEEMNNNGRALLENCLVYISKFTEDRPLALKLSTRNSPRSRRIMNDILESYKPVDIARFFANPWQSRMKAMSKLEAKNWLQVNDGFFYAIDQGEFKGRLAIDEDAKALGIRIDKPSFLTTAAAVLTDSKRAGQMKKVLVRQITMGPGIGASSEAWRTYLEEERPYLFYSEQGGYRWVVDTLAKSRGVPSENLRGPERATIVELQKAQTKHR